MRWALAVAVLALVSVAAGASAVDAELRVGERFVSANTTLALGHLDPGAAELSDVHAVDVDRLTVPEGTLYVCPWQGGEAEEVPPLPALQDRCRDEDSYEAPQLTVGDRTWLALEGNMTLQRPPNASTTALVADRENASLHLASVTSGALTAAVDDQMAFRPQRPASQIHVEADGEERTYNGTDWVFYLEASGSLELAAAGVHVQVPAPVDLTLTPAGSAQLREALDVRTLLDLQAAAVEPDAREPVANVTRLLGPSAQIPPLVDGALTGSLNGTIGQRSFTPEEPSLVGLHRLEGTFDGPSLTGDLDARFVQTEAGIAPGLSTPAGVPWLLGVLLWIGAAVSFAVGPAPVVRGMRQRLLAAGAFGLALVLWDRILAGALGTSAGTALAGEAGLGVVLALVAFEAIAFGLAWLLLALPLRLAGERWLVDRAAVHVSGLASAALLVYAWIRPGAVLSIGRLATQI